MLNQVALVGRVIEDIELKVNNNGNLNEKKLKKYIKDYFKDELIKFNYISIKAIN